MPLLVLPTALVLGGVAALVQASLKAIDAKEAAMSVSEAAAPFLAVAFVLCLLGALAGAGGFKPTHLSEDPAYRRKDILESRPDFAVFNHRGPYLRSRQK